MRDSFEFARVRIRLPIENGAKMKMETKINGDLSNNVRGRNINKRKT